MKFRAIKIEGINSRFKKYCAAGFMYVKQVSVDEIVGMWKIDY